MRGSKLAGLDGIRGLAALVVLWFHAGTITKGWWPPSSYLCVDLFFLLSGFVVPYAYEARMRAGLSFGRFLEIRLIRLYPLYILGVAISLMPYLYEALVHHHRWVLRDPLDWLFPWALLMIPKPGAVPMHSFLLNPPAWSLFLELAVNIAYALALPRLSNRMLLGVVAVSTAVLAVAAGRYGTGDFGTGGYEMLWAIARVGCPFSIGVLLFRRWSARGLPLAGAPAWAPVLLFALLVLVPVPAGLAWLLVPLLVAVGGTLIVVLAAGLSPRPATVRWAEAGGALSYPLYALHLPLLIVTQQMLALAGLGAATAVPVGMALSLVVAPLAGRWYDQPVRAWLTRRLALRRARVEAPAL